MRLLYMLIRINYLFQTVYKPVLIFFAILNIDTNFKLWLNIINVVGYKACQIKTMYTNGILRPLILLNKNFHIVYNYFNTITYKFLEIKNIFYKLIQGVYTQTLNKKNILLILNINFIQLLHM